MKLGQYLSVFLLMLFATVISFGVEFESIIMIFGGALLMLFTLAFGVNIL